MSNPVYFPNLVMDGMRAADAAEFAPPGRRSVRGGNRDVERQAAAIRRGAQFITTQTDIGFMTAAATQWTAGIRNALAATPVA